MAHYDIFRHHLAITFPAYGHALWEPGPGSLYPAVEVGDVGYIREGKFHRLFNVLLSASHPTHRNFGVPEYHEQLTLNMEDHINVGRLSSNNFCSAKVTSTPVSEPRSANGPDEASKVSFSCRRKKEGAVLCLPVPAKTENTVASVDFGNWIIKHIDRWFVWAQQLGLRIDRMEDIVLVTGTHSSRSWTNVVFPGGQGGGQTSFGAKVDHRGDILAINWQFSHEHNRGAVLNCGPDGKDLPEDQCIFVRGFRATRRLRILPPKLKGAAEPNPDSGYDEEPDAELVPVPALPEYRDPLHILLEYIAEEAPPSCDMFLIHDDDLVRLDGIYDSTPLAALQLDVVLSRVRSLKPMLHGTQVDLSSDHSASVDTECTSAWVATLSNIFEKQSPSSTHSASQSLHAKMSSPTSELSQSSTSFRDDLLGLPTSEASFPQQNVPGSADTLPGHATNRFVDAQQPESDPIHRLLPSYGESPSSESVSSHGSGSENPYPNDLNSFFRFSPGSAVTLSTSIAPTASSTVTLVKTSRSTQPHARIGSIGNSSDPFSPGEAPLVILRVQVISCNNLEAKDRNGYSNPFVVVSIFGKEFRTPVCKRNLNPVYAPKDATFDFPIYMSLVQRLGTLNLKFVVWDKDMFGKDFLGKNALPVNEWFKLGFKDTAFAFNDPHNQPIQIGLLSSRTTTILHGTMCIKVGFVHPPNSTSQLDFGNIYNTLAYRVLPGPQADHVGIVTLLIWGARDLPDWPTVTHIGWDMDPYVKVRIGDEAQSTQVIRHDRNPVWNKQLVFHVRERDLSLPIVLSVFHWNRLSFDDHVGDHSIYISQLDGTTSKKDRTAGFISDGLPSMFEFNDVHLLRNPRKPYKHIPTLTFRAGYQSYDELRQQVGH